MRTHGILRGSALAAWRLVRCNPFSKGGVDEVPPPRSSSATPTDPRLMPSHAEIILPLANILQPIIDVADAILTFFAEDLALGYGVAIILLTIVTRLAILPLSLKQIKSMRALRHSGRRSRSSTSATRTTRSASSAS